MLPSSPLQLPFHSGCQSSALMRGSSAFERAAHRSEKLRLRRTHTGRQGFELFKDGRGKKVAGNPERQTRALVAPDSTIQN